MAVFPPPTPTAFPPDRWAHVCRSCVASYILQNHNNLDFKHNLPKKREETRQKKKIQTFLRIFEAVAVLRRVSGQECCLDQTRLELNAEIITGSLSDAKMSLLAVKHSALVRPRRSPKGPRPAFWEPYKHTRTHVRAHQRARRQARTLLTLLHSLRGSSGWEADGARVAQVLPSCNQASADSHRGGLCSGSTLTFTHFSRVFRSLFLWGGSREHARQPAAPPPGRPGTADKAATYHFQMHFIFIHRLQSGTEEQRDGWAK